MSLSLSSSVVVVGGDGTWISRCVAMSLCDSNRIRFIVVIDTTPTPTTTIQFLKSRSTIRTVNLTMSSTAPQFFTNAHDITMINPVISNYQYVGGE